MSLLGCCFRLTKLFAPKEEVKEASNEISKELPKEKKEDIKKEEKEEVITIDDFAKVKLRVGKVLSCEKHMTAS